MADHLSGRRHVVVQLNAIQSPGFPGFSHNAARHDMQRVQLDAVDAGLYHAVQRFQAVMLFFSRQADNQMGTDLQPTLACQPGGALIAGKIMTAVDTVQGFIVGGLQSQLQPDLIPLLFVFAEQIQHRLRHAVRPCPDAEPDDIGLAHRLLIHGAQHLHFRPCAGIGLKIGQILICPVNPRCLVGELCRDRLMLLRFVGKRGHITEGTAATPDSAVAVRAAKSPVERQLMDLLPVAA